MDKFRNIDRKKPKADPKRRCHRCHGTGRAPCGSCGGQGRVLTGKDRLGHPVHGQCNACYGTRTRKCNNCSGEGFV